MPLFTIAVQNAFPHRVLGQVTATRQFFMSLGGAIGVPIMGALLNSGFTSNMRSQLSPALRTLLAKQGGSNLDPNTLISAEAQAAIHAKFAQLGPQGAVLYRQFIFAVRDGLALTMQPLFHLALGFMLCGLIVTLFLKEIPLRRHQIAAESVVADEEAAIVGAPEPVSLRAPADEPA
jgi:hypothetical protein